MLLKTNSDISKAFKKIHSLVSHIDEMKSFGFNVLNLEEEAQNALSQLTDYIESLPVDKNYSTTLKLYFVLEGNIWIPVNNIELNTQSGCIWYINEDASEVRESGTCRFGRYCEIGADLKPYLKLTLDDLREVNPIYL